MKIKRILLVVVFIQTVAMAGNYIEPNDHVLEVKAPIKVNNDWQSKQQFFGFSQVGIGLGKGVSKNADYKFQADRIRLAWKYFSGPVVAKVFLDFAKEGSDQNGMGVPELIKDAFIAYKFDDAVVVKAGMIKTPIGMGFTIPGWNLDVIKRGFDKKLAFERDFGIMLSGRDIGFDNNAKVNGLEMGHERPWKGFGYDLMFAGQAGRSGAVINAYSGNAEAYMGRLMFDWGQKVHIEASYGISKNAGGTVGAKNVKNQVIITTDLEDYKVFNAGIDSHFDRANVKAEFYSVENIRGKIGWDMITFALTGTYYITDTIEFSVKDIFGIETINLEDREARNTYIGFNYYINPQNNKMDRISRRKRNQHRVQFNYVYVNVDKEFKGVGALFKEDAVLLQYQFKF